VSARDLSPEDVQVLLGQQGVVLVDVREPGEYAAERIAGAVNFPLSRFAPASLPAGRLILQCGVGRRSAAAMAQCDAVGREQVVHMAGGLMAWKAAGLPTEA